MLQHLAPANDDAIAQRKAAVMQAFAHKTHEKSKSKELDAFSSFLRSRPTEALRRASVFEAIPADVVDFLVHRDLTGNGRTIVHRPDCNDRDTPGCGCPARMAQSGVHTLLSKVKTRLYELGCSGEWDSRSGTGNPADSSVVQKYLIAIKEEQGRAGCTAVSARQRAMLPQKLQRLVESMRDQAYAAYAKDKVKWVSILQDIAWITVQFRSLNRGAELSFLRTDMTIIGPNDSCVVFQVTFSKVIRGDSTREFGCAEIPGDPTCPVRAFKQYVEETNKLFRWAWDKGSYWVFPYIGMRGDRLADNVTASAMAQRFNKYLKVLDPEESEQHESLHGLRAGGALDMAREGKVLKEVMLQGFWRSPKTALRYIGLLEGIIGQEFAAAVQDKGLRDHWKGAPDGSVQAGNFRFSLSM